MNSNSSSNLFSTRREFADGAVSLIASFMPV